MPCQPPKRRVLLNLYDVKDEQIDEGRQNAERQGTRRQKICPNHKKSIDYHTAAANSRPLCRCSAPTCLSGGRAAFASTLHGYIYRDLHRIAVRTPKRGMRGNLAVGRPSRTAISDIYEDGLIVMIWSVVCLRTGHQGLFTARIRVIPEPRRPDISLQPSIICRPFSDGLLICENCSSRHDEYSGQNILTRRARESAALAFRRIKGDLLCV